MNRSVIPLLIIFLLISGKASPQDFKIAVTFKGLAQKTAILGTFIGEKVRVLDSARTDKDGMASFRLDAKSSRGMYRCMIERTTHTDFIFNAEDVELVVDPAKEDERIKVLKSEENRIYYDFLEENRLLSAKLESLNHLRSTYPVDDKFISIARKEFMKVQEKRDVLISDNVKKHKGTFASRLIAMQYLPLLQWEWNDEQKKSYMIAHFFDRLQFNDTMLIRSTIYPNKVIEYLSYYASPTNNQKQQEQAFIRGIDVVMEKVRAEQRIFEFILSYLAGGFEQYKMEEVLTHLKERYVSELNCDEGTGRTLATRLEAYEKMSVGKTAPPWDIVARDGKHFTSENLQKDYTLLVFWSTSCPHCKNLIPELRKYFSGSDLKKLTVATLSLDTSFTAWADFIGQHGSGWINSCDLLGWDGKIVKDYNIYATPTMFLMDKQRKILAKPITIYDLMSVMNDNKLIGK